MKKSTILVAVLALVCLSLSLVLAEHHINTDLDAVFKAGFSALQAKDIEAFGAVHKADGIHIGAAAGQLAMGWEDYKTMIEDFLASGGQLTGPKAVAAKVVGNAGWGVWEFTNVMEADGKKMETPMRLTLVFEKDGDKWLVSHSHVSAGLPPMAPPPSMEK